MTTPHGVQAVGLDADEELVARAQRLLIGLGAALVHRPFDTDVHERLRAFLTDDAAGVLTSLRVLRQRPEAQLRRRIAELCGDHIRVAGSAS
ncbi:hypothetical protein P3T27_007679 [Kitasatospora sp. MAA19]|uniref:hypothetical protein n=1 Tax=unclassified Kitasatospora TaxID=2633591 RepID=UPI0024731E60|nr:hypothetical protein [Kitasatospora sp. MAA19]MDH6710928.1 hypothetical protein [Kitasatospora sp. MAA19]